VVENQAPLGAWITPQEIQGIGVGFAGKRQIAPPSAGKGCPSADKGCPSADKGCLSAGTGKGALVFWDVIARLCRDLPIPVEYHY
jgi:hypothetical protein